MQREKLRFPGSQGRFLGAELDRPEAEPPLAYAIFAHCFTCSKNLKAARNINLALTGAGIGVLRFDFTGLGESEGDFSDTNFSSNIEDLVAAARYLGGRYRSPALLIGHSLGGAAVLQAAKYLPSSVAVVTIGAPFDPGYVTRLFSGKLDEIERTGEAEVLLAGRRFKIKKQFLDDLARTKMEGHIANLDKALLVLHSPQDEVAGIDNGAEIFAAARHPKSFVSLDGADHLLAQERDSRYVGEMISTWAGRYLR